MEQKETLEIKLEVINLVLDKLSEIPYKYSAEAIAILHKAANDAYTEKSENTQEEE